MRAAEIKEKLQRSAGQNERYYLTQKRVLDIVVAAVGLVLLSPLMLVTAFAIVLESPGNPIFAQIRIGKNGKPFTMYKFRSMHLGAEERLAELLPQNEMDGPVFKMRRDPRVTRVGRVIRKCCIDELPQLWNVLWGDMSIVGPRPGLPHEVAQYSARARQRLRVEPGLTCYWQTQPRRNEMGFAQWMELDMKYIRERSLKTDRKIIMDTVRMILGIHEIGM